MVTKVGGADLGLLEGGGGGESVVTFTGAGSWILILMHSSSHWRNSSSTECWRQKGLIVIAACAPWRRRRAFSHKFTAKTLIQTIWQQVSQHGTFAMALSGPRCRRQLPQRRTFLPGDGGSRPDRESRPDYPGSTHHRPLLHFQRRRRQHRPPSSSPNWRPGRRLGVTSTATAHRQSTSSDRCASSAKRHRPRQRQWQSAAARPVDDEAHSDRHSGSNTVRQPTTAAAYATGNRRRRQPAADPSLSSSARINLLIIFSAPFLSPSMPRQPRPAETWTRRLGTADADVLCRSRLR